MQPDRLTDAQLIAEWARYALGEGRYTLAEALTRLAVQADRAERRTVNVPFAARTRAEHPVRVQVQVDTPPLAPPAEPMPEENATYAEVAEQIRATADRTAVFARPYLVPDPINGAITGPEPRPVDLPAPRRCTAVVTRDGVPGECRAVIRMNTTTGGANYWTHLDPDLDVDHMPIGVVDQ